MTDPFDGLPAFLAVAETRSFTAAAARLGVSPAAMSQAVRAMEKRLGTPLFARTTRRVGLTEAGAALFAKARPAAAEIAAAVEAVGAMGDRPTGRLRLTLPRIAVDLFAGALVKAYCAACPDVTLDVSVDDHVVDLAAEGFDAGIRIGEAVERDMIAVKLTPDFRWLVVGAPSYFARHGRPETPEALRNHACIRYRFPTSGTIYRWEFARQGRAFSVGVDGPLIVDDGALGVELAVRGLGLTYSADWILDFHLRRRRLIPVLEDFAVTSAGFYLYFVNRAQTQPKLRAFIDIARQVVGR
jgi:DNA-binding transcriptional LysR family regulator